jgi:hypothetical protein
VFSNRSCHHTSDRVGLCSSIQAMHACTHAAARKLQPSGQPSSTQHPCYLQHGEREGTACLVGRKSSRHAYKVHSAMGRVLGLRSVVDDGLPLHKRTLVYESASSRASGL